MWAKDVGVMKLRSAGAVLFSLMIVVCALSAGMQVSAASSNADKNWWKDAGYLNANDNSSVLDSIYDSGSNHSLMGKLSSKGHGHFVKFAFESTTAEITDLQLKDRNGFVDVVTSIKIENFEPTEAISRGSIMAVGNETVGMVVHDNPTGMVRITVVNSSADISYLFPEGVRVSRTSEISSGSPFNSVLLSGDAKSAVLASNNGTMTVEQVENGTYVNVTVEDGVAVLRFKPLFSHNPAFEEAVLVGIYGGNIGGEISIVAKDGSAAYDQMRYGDLNIELLVADPDRLELNISSEKEQGKVIIINIDPDSVPSLENLTVFMDGTVVRQVDDPLQVLYASGSSMNDAVYSIVHDDDHVNLIIYIPHFSSHSLVISGAAAIMDEVAGPMEILVAVSAIALVGFAATALFRRKK